MKTLSKITIIDEQDPSVQSAVLQMPVNDQLMSIFGL